MHVFVCVCMHACVGVSGCVGECACTWRKRPLIFYMIRIKMVVATLCNVLITGHRFEI